SVLRSTAGVCDVFEQPAAARVTASASTRAFFMRATPTLRVHCVESLAFYCGSAGPECLRPTYINPKLRAESPGAFPDMKRPRKPEPRPEPEDGPVARLRDALRALALPAEAQKGLLPSFTGG